MSGFLPEGLANWALGGGAGQGADDDDASDNNNEAQAPQISEQDMRAKRMARLAALEKKETNSSSNEMDIEKGDAAEPMQVDQEEGKKPAAAEVIAKKESSSSLSASAAATTATTPKVSAPDVTMAQEPVQKKPKSPADPLAKLRRKKILLIRRVLLVTFGEDALDRTPACVHLQLDDDEVYNTNKSPEGVNIGHITDLLVSRLNLHPSSRSLETMPPQKPGLIAYLAGCHKRAGEEWKDLKQKKKGDGSEEELCEILEEIRKQVVSYAASSLQLPELFPLGSDSSVQLAKCLSTTTTDPISSVTFDVMGKNTSFYFCVCEELHSQDPDAFETVVADIVTRITDALSKCKSLLDESPPDAAGLGGNGLFLTSALRELCTHKKAASCLTKVPSFVLPPADSPQASEWVGGPPPPQIPRGANPNQIRYFRQLQEMSNARMRRSGKALEKDTVLGNILRLGLPWKNESMLSSFSNPVRKSPKDVDQICEGHRRQLEMYQNKCNELIRQLVVAGEDPRNKVIQWLTDALLVNSKADAIERDPTKVSSEELLYNLSVVLLKLCDPFVSNPNKAALVDPGFVSSPKSHGGVYDLTGDNALTRLGENVSHSGDVYNPKNSFIPLCFFFCSRALALSIVPGMLHYDEISRSLSHMAWRIRQANGDIFSDRRFDYSLKVKFAMGVVVKSPTYIGDVFRFYNTAAGFLLRLDNDQLKTMPEHLVSDVCAVLDFAADHTTKLLSGIDFGNAFRLTVKLLSKDCAKLVRNYNLRASLGDILHDIFLPGDSDHRNDIPDSVICDPLSGGRTYLVSDKMCQDTLAPSLLLLYGEVETTGFYEKSKHRVKIAALLKYLWDSPEHKPAFRKVAEDQEGFIVFANGIINDMNDKFAGVMEKLPAIRTVQLQMANPQEWAAISEEERETIMERHEENERLVGDTLNLCDNVLKMLGFLNTDKAIRDMFLLPDMCPRLANMLLFVLTKLVGSRGLDLKVDNPEKYNFRPKELLQNVCVVFASFADADTFQVACAKSGYYTSELLSKSVKTCRKLGLLVGESMDLFEQLEGKVEEMAKTLGDDEELYEDAPDEFLDPVMSEFMTDPVILPTSDTIVDRTTIKQHLLNDPTDPFNRKPLSIDDVIPAEELKQKMKVWLDAKKLAKAQSEGA